MASMLIKPNLMAVYSHEADKAAVDWLTTYGSQHTIIIIMASEGRQVLATLSQVNQEPLVVTDKVG